jgi:uncharacterized protein (UPF0261 family)
MAIILIATLDTKGVEIGFVRDRLQSLGIVTTVIDGSVLGEPALSADIPREEVFRAAGTTLDAVRQQADRGHAVAKAAEGVRAIVRDLHRDGRVDGVFALGGSAGTTIGTAAMRALPLGIPKLMVSTLASGQVRPFVGPRDIAMFHSVTDIAGINRISRAILSNAANAMAGMIQGATPSNPLDKPIVTATMFGVTTPCVEACRDRLERAGFEVLVFHAVGTGGEAMESLISDRLVTGVLDLTTTELADELVGGVLSAGPSRLTAAAEAGIPQVVSVGAMDMVNFGPRETVPAKFADRTFYIHNAHVTLMRTTPEENAQLGRILAEKLALSRGPYRILLPTGGVSAIDAPGKPFWDPAADLALFESIRGGLPADRVINLDLHINDPAFAERAVAELNRMMAVSNSPSPAPST